jgi:membrane-associated protein
MDKSFIDVLLHVDTQLVQLIHQYGTLIYAILFGTVFIETGLVITPFLPGDSLLFAAGLLSRPEKQLLNVYLLLIGFPVAAILGDLVNFNIGKFFGKLLYKPDDKGLLKKKHLEKTRAFFELHGQKAIIMGRFVPVLRAVIPFVAGMDGMSMKWFFPLSVMAAFVWVFVCVGAGHLLGGLQVVQDNFSLAMLGVVGLSVVGFVIESVRHKMKKPVATPVANSEKV